MEILLSGLRNITVGRGREAGRLAVLFCAACWFFAPTLLHAAPFSALLDRTTIALGETATLSLTFTGGSPQNAPSPPSVPNLDIQYVGPSSQFSVINGQVSST